MRRKGRKEEACSEFMASAEVAALAALLDEQHLSDIGDIIREIGRRCGYRETAKRFRPAFQALRNSYGLH